MTDIEICEMIIEKGHCGDASFLRCEDCPLSLEGHNCLENNRGRVKLAKQWLKDHQEEEWEEYSFFNESIVSKPQYNNSRWVYFNATNGVIIRDSYDYKIEIIDGVVYGYRKLKSKAKKTVTLELTQEQLEKIKEIIE